MPSIKSSIELPITVERAYQHLSTRYTSARYRAAAIDTKGYLPKIICTDSQPNEKITYSVPGWEPLLRISLGDWNWSYRIEKSGHDTTKVTIEYNWSHIMTLMTFGTIRHQAANELTETVIALEALATPWPNQALERTAIAAVRTTSS